MTQLAAFAARNLCLQGFCDKGDPARSSLQWSVRFTPAVSIALVAVGLVQASPGLVGIMALVALCGAIFPKAMPIDLLYNLGVRHLFHLAPLPPTPKPRQLSYLISAVLLVASALAFLAGYPLAGRLLGGAVCVAGAVLVTTLWCLGSWLYALIFGPVVAAG